MEARQLRIGNFVVLSSDTIGKVEEIRTNTAKCRYMRQDTGQPAIGMVRHEDIQPIPLTEEWLVKLGFRKGEYNEYERNMAALKVKARVYYGHCYIELGGIYMGEIESVHRLQNIWQSMTGQELEISHA